jgi:putative membrane protein
MDAPTRPTQKADIRDYLAAERTLLAWIRTGLALTGFGFVVARFGIFLQQLQAMQRTAVQSYGLSLWFGTVLIAVGVIVNIFAGWHHLRLVREWIVVKPNTLDLLDKRSRLLFSRLWPG